MKIKEIWDNFINGTEKEQETEADDAPEIRPAV